MFAISACVPEARATSWSDCTKLMSRLTRSLPVVSVVPGQWNSALLSTDLPAAVKRAFPRTEDALRALRIRKGIASSWEPDHRIVGRITGAERVLDAAPDPATDVFKELARGFDEYFPAAIDAGNAVSAARAAYFLEAARAQGVKLPADRVVRLVSHVRKGASESSLARQLSALKRGDAAAREPVLAELDGMMRDCRVLTEGEPEARRLFLATVENAAPAESRGEVPHLIFGHGLASDPPAAQGEWLAEFSTSPAFQDIRLVDVVTSPGAWRDDPHLRERFLSTLEKQAALGKPEDRRALLEFADTLSSADERLRVASMVSQRARGDGSEIGAWIGRRLRIDASPDSVRGLAPLLQKTGAPALDQAVTGFLRAWVNDAELASAARFSERSVHAARIVPESLRPQLADARRLLIREHLGALSPEAARPWLSELFSSLPAAESAVLARDLLGVGSAEPIRSLVSRVIWEGYLGAASAGAERRWKPLTELALSSAYFRADATPISVARHLHPDTEGMPWLRKVAERIAAARRADTARASRIGASEADGAFLLEHGPKLTASEAQLDAFELASTAPGADAARLAEWGAALLERAAAPNVPGIRRRLARILESRPQVADSTMRAYLAPHLTSVGELDRVLAAFGETYGQRLASRITAAKRALIAERVGKAPAAEKRAWAHHDPELTRQADHEILDLLRTSPTPEGDASVRAIVEHQASINSRLPDLLEHYVQSGAPPAPFATMERPWGRFFEQLPTRLQKPLLDRLLRGATTSRQVTALVRQLEPLPGFGDVIARRLDGTPLMTSNRSEFSHEQIDAMFAGDRFGRFFPWVPVDRVNIGAKRTKFIIAVMTRPGAPPANLGTAWLREKLLDESVAYAAAESLGFRPAISYARIASQLRDAPDAEWRGQLTDAAQARGLVVQGYYERNGRSVMFVQNGTRGSDQVETRAPEVVTNLNDSLGGGWLSRAEPLTRRWMAYNWNLNADQGLIGRMRDRAIWISNNTNRAFWNLRVEIHNFPTGATLARTKAFLANNRLGNQVQEQLRIIIREIESLLGSGGANADMDAVIASLSTSDALKTELRDVWKPHAEGTPLERLGGISAMRAKWSEIADRPDALTNRHIRRYTGDRSLSDQAVSLGSAALEELAKPGHAPSAEEIVPLAEQILHHTRLDDLLTPEQERVVADEIRRIAGGAELDPSRRLELISRSLQNAVDQVSFAVDRRFGAVDRAFPKVSAGTATPPAFVDTVMRSQNAFMLSKLSDWLERSLLAKRGITHELAGAPTHEPIQVFNPGERVGVLRFNRPADELAADDIAVFERMPPESAPVQGFITLQDGARLSHLQLLARSLGIPNARFSPEQADALKALDGKWVRYRAGADSRVVLEETVAPGHGVVTAAKPSAAVKVPEPDHSVTRPVSFADAKDLGHRNFAGPKGLNLARLRNDPRTAHAVPDGAIVPFGYFRQYAERTGLAPWLDLLSKLELKNADLISVVTERIQRHLATTKVPDEMLDAVMHEVEALKGRTGGAGFFLRSDTNLEDLHGFNGAGLNQSVANVPAERARIEAALRKVWSSPFLEKSVYWRAQALPSPTVTLAEPSVVIMPVISAKNSGVSISRGGPDWKPGHGLISANWGIGSVVEAGAPVEEITLETGKPIRYALTVSDRKPVAAAQGGLGFEPVAPGTPVLSPENVRSLNEETAKVESVLGPLRHGWDIEWAHDADDKAWILQARPNE